MNPLIRLRYIQLFLDHLQLSTSVLTTDWPVNSYFLKDAAKLYG